MEINKDGLDQTLKTDNEIDNNISLERQVEKQKDKRNPKREEIIEDSTKERWAAVASEIETTADTEGYGIDKGIKEIVVALNVFGINTSQSCEGHDGQVESGMSAPWVRIEAPDEPEERFVGQDVVFEKVAKKYNMPIEETKRMFNMDAYWEAAHEFCENGETEEFKKWKEGSEKLLYLVKDLLTDFYDKREVSENIRIKTNVESVEDLTEGSFEIFNGGADYRIITDEKLSSEEAEALKSRIVEYRAEMKAFSDFLKKQYFNKGESYITEKTKIAQEKIDAEKLKNIRGDKLAE